MSVASEEYRATKHDRRAPGFHHLGWNVDTREQVDLFYELLLKVGAQVLDAPAEYEYQHGYYAVYFTDPDGLKLEVVHIPLAEEE